MHSNTYAALNFSILPIKHFNTCTKLSQAKIITTVSYTSFKCFAIRRVHPLLIKTIALLTINFRTFQKWLLKKFSHLNPFKFKYIFYFDFYVITSLKHNLCLILAENFLMQHSFLTKIP